MMWGVAAIVLAAAFSMLAQPADAQSGCTEAANGCFANATRIPGGTSTTAVSGSASESGEPSCAATRSGWLKFTASSNMSATMTIQVGSGGVARPGVAIGVYQGTSLGSLSSITCTTSDANGMVAPTIFCMAGQTYDIQINMPAGFPSLNATVFNPCGSVGCWSPNDCFANATSLTSGAAAVTFDNANATSEMGEPACAPARSIWYRFTASASGTARVNVTSIRDGGTPQSGAPSGIFTGATVAELSSVSCLVSNAVGQVSHTFSCVPGETYYVQIGTVSGGVHLTGPVSVSGCGPITAACVPLANDCFANSTLLASPATATINSTASFTAQPSEPLTNGIGATAWYHFTAGSNGVATVDTFGSGFDTTLVVYTGSTLAFLSTLVWADSSDDIAGYQESLNFTCVAGTTYRIQVGGARNLTGPATLHLDGCRAAPAAPTSPTASASASAPSVSFGWTHAFNASAPTSEYRIYRGLASGAETLYRTIPYVAGQTSFVDTNVSTNTRYWYQVSAANGPAESARSSEASATTICWSANNDCFVNATVVSAVPFWTNVSTVGKTLEQFENSGCAAVSFGNTAWYSWTALTSGTATVSTAYPGTDHNTGLVAFTGSALNALGFVTCNDDFSGTKAQISFSCTAGTTYRILLGTRGAPGNATLSIQGCGAATVPSAPTGLTALASGNGNVTISWGAPVSNGGSAITNYSIQRGTASGALSPLLTVGNVTSYVDTGRTGGTTYFYKVAAVNGVGAGPLSNEASATATTTPGAVHVFNATASAGRVDLTWTPPSNGGTPITSYSILRSASGSFRSAVGNATGNATAWTDVNVSQGTTYVYEIMARNVVGTGPISSERTVTTPTFPGAPNATISASTTALTLSWTPPSDGGSAILGYDVYRVANAGTPLLFRSIGAATSFADTNVTAGTTYFYQVSARNAVGNGSRSNVLNASLLAAPSAPQGLAGASGPNGGEVTLTWSAPASANPSVSGYKIYRSDTAGGTKALRGNTSGALTFRDTGLVGGRAYFYQVAAVNAVGEGARTAEVRVVALCNGAGNDCFVNAMGLGTSRPLAFTLDNTGATVEDGEPMPSCRSGNGQTVWARFTAQTSGRAHVDQTLAQSSLRGTTIQIFTGASVTGLTRVACDLGGGPGDLSSVAFDCVAGRTYHIQVSSELGATGEADFKLDGCGVEEDRVVNDDDDVGVAAHRAAQQCASGTCAGGDVVFRGKTGKNPMFPRKTEIEGEGAGQAGNTRGSEKVGIVVGPMPMPMPGPLPPCGGDCQPNDLVAHVNSADPSGRHGASIDGSAHDDQAAFVIVAPMPGPLPPCGGDCEPADFEQYAGEMGSWSQEGVRIER